MALRGIGILSEIECLRSDTLQQFNDTLTRKAACCPLAAARLCHLQKQIDLLDNGAAFAGNAIGRGGIHQERCTGDEIGDLPRDQRGLGETGEGLQSIGRHFIAGALQSVNRDGGQAEYEDAGKDDRKGQAKGDGGKEGAADHG